MKKAKPMDQKRKKKFKRTASVVCIVIVLIMAVIILACYVVIHSYINKMNLVDIEDISISEQEGALYKDEDELESEPDDLIEDVPDSSPEEVDTVEDMIQQNIEYNQTPVISDKNVTNILLIGCDTRKKSGEGRSDAIIIISINKKMKTITATSILRDIYLQIPGKRNNRINAAYAMGGASLLLDTIEQNFKLELDRFVAVDFYAFVDIVDAVGGVTIEVSDEEIRVMNSYIKEINHLTGKDESLDQLTDSGSYHLNGKQTLGYVRNRYVGSDFARTARQRKVLEEIFDGVKDLGLPEINRLMNLILPQVTTNLTEGELVSMILALPSYASYELQQISIPISNSYDNLRINKMAVLGIDFEMNIKEIQSIIYNSK